MSFFTTHHNKNGPNYGRLYHNRLDVASCPAAGLEGIHVFPVGWVVIIYIFLTTRRRELAGIIIIISIAIVATIIIATSNVAASVIASSDVFISSADPLNFFFNCSGLHGCLCHVGC